MQSFETKAELDFIEVENAKEEQKINLLVGWGSSINSSHIF